MVLAKDRWEIALGAGIDRRDRKTPRLKLVNCLATSSISCKIVVSLAPTMICPKCNENQAHRSRRSGFKDWAARLMMRIPYRCRACKTRSYVSLHGGKSM